MVERFVSFSVLLNTLLFGLFSEMPHQSKTRQPIWLNSDRNVLQDLNFWTPNCPKQRSTMTSSTAEAALTLPRDGSDSYDARNTNSNIYQYVTHGSRGFGQRPKRVTSYTDSIINVYSEIDSNREGNGKGIRCSYPIYEDPNEPYGAAYGFLKSGTPVGTTTGMNKDTKDTGWRGRTGVWNGNRRGLLHRNGVCWF